MANFTYPNFNIPAYPYQDLQQQMLASMQQPSTGGLYGRWAVAPRQQGPGLLGGANGPFGTPQPYGGTTAPNLVTNPGAMPGMPGAPMPIGDQWTQGLNPNAPMEQAQAGTTQPVGVSGGPQSYYTNPTTFGMNTGPQNGQAFSSNTFNFNPADANNPASAQFIAGYNRKNPQMQFTVDDFNRANASDGQTAMLMATLGGQQFRNAIMGQDGWSQNQMNQFLNTVGYNGNGSQYRGLNPANVAALQKYGATFGGG